MSTRQQQRRARLQAEYGIEFPDDFYRLWDFANRLAPLAPLTALGESLGITLVGPFEVLAGRFDGRVPRHSLLLHWRYYGDPPEFFTVLAGDADGLHWGHYLDDPRDGRSCVVSYYARDSFELSVDGDTLFDAVRLHLEHVHGDLEQYRADAAADGEGTAPYDERLAALEAVRRRLMEQATGDRPETGEAYTERYSASSRDDRVTAETMEGVGIVVPAGQYRPLSMSDRKLWKHLRKGDAADLIAEARQALSEGFPGTALKLGKDLWAAGGVRRMEAACDLLEEAYAALGRGELLRVLQTHRANRELSSVDILEDEGA